ncbi:hypothetical protein Tco_0271747 [Tanacetum coccineum]
MIDCNETLIPMDPGTRLTKITEGTMVNSTEYRSLIGCLRYLLHTRPDLSYSVGLLSRFMQEPREQHMKAIRQVLRYVKGTKDYGITYKHNGGNKIHGFSDSSYGVNTQEGKGTTGIIFYYGESPISWSTQKQATVALSSCESEFIAATAAATQALWLKRLLSKLTHSEEEKVTIRVDNKSAIALMKNPVFHGRSKHIDTKYHFIRECVEREDIQVEFKFDLDSYDLYISETLDLLRGSGLTIVSEGNETCQKVQTTGMIFAVYLSSYDLYINETLDLFRGSGLTIVSEGNETVFIEGRKLPLVYLTALRHALDVDKANWIVHVSDVGQRDYIETCITVLVVKSDSGKQDVNSDSDE